MIRDLSFRYRVPLNLSLVVLATGLCIAGIVLWHDFRAVRDDARHSAEQLGRLLTYALSHELAVDDTWQAYRTLRSVFQDAGDTWLLPDHALVVDSEGATVLTSDPFRFPLALPAEALGRDLPQFLAIFSNLKETGDTFEGDGVTYRFVPVHAGDIRLGTLVLAFSNQRLWPRFYQSAVQVVVTTGVILLVLLPLGWMVGRRLAGPLSELESCVARLVEGGDLSLACPVQESNNELGRLRACIESVSVELKDKRALERQVLRSERQAALGRLAASVAHEINNPLGGMFTAIAMFKRHGREPQVADKTVSLLERGLDQIRHIVSALLVEVKAEPRNVGPQDMEDIVELVAPRAQRRRVRLDWAQGLEDVIALPAGPVRQVLINLVFNAIQAAPEEGCVEVGIEREPGALTIRVANEGESIPEERLERLFEPFTESSWGGSGLGLWITDQTVRQLRGRIEAISGAGRMVFRVILPIETGVVRQE